MAFCPFLAIRSGAPCAFRTEVVSFVFRDFVIFLLLFFLA